MPFYSRGWYEGRLCGRLWAHGWERKNGAPQTVSGEGTARREPPRKFFNPGQFPLPPACGARPIVAETGLCEFCEKRARRQSSNRYCPLRCQQRG